MGAGQFATGIDAVLTRTQALHCEAARLSRLPNEAMSPWPAVCGEGGGGQGAGHRRREEDPRGGVGEYKGSLAVAKNTRTGILENALNLWALVGAVGA